MNAARSRLRGGVTGLSLLACAWLPASFGTAGGARPNILLIVADDHGREALGCYGNPVVRTPHLDGRSFRAGLDGGALPGWDEIFASHSFHGITQYYPMRVVRTRHYKLIHNLASPLPFPQALDLIKSPTWISTVESGGKMLGARSIGQLLQRPEFELYDLEHDPQEVRNLADEPAFQGLKAGLIEKLKAFQATTKDPWLHKWTYE